MLRSFKLKIALFAFATSGIILVAFTSLFMSVVRRVGAERIDRNLFTLADGQLRHPPHPEQWPQFEKSLSSLYGETNRPTYLISVIDSDGAPVYTSERWPRTLTVEGLELPELEEPPALPKFEMPRDLPMPEAIREHPELDASPAQPKPDGDRDLQEPPQGVPPPHRHDRKMPPMWMWRSQPRFLDLRAEDRNWRFVILRNGRDTLFLGIDMAELQSEIKRFRTTFMAVGSIGLLLLAAAGWLLAGQALRPVKVLTRIAGNMTAKGLHQRVQIPGADREFQALIEVINGMLSRLETSFNQAVRFSADAAHELKTPLTILQGQLSQVMQSAPSGSDQQRTYADLLEEVQRLKSIVRKLLLLAQSDSGQLRLSLENVCLSDEVEALLEDAPLLAPGLTLRKEIAPGIHVQADPDLIRQVLQNLFSNAVKYNCENGMIECRLWRDENAITFTLANTTAPGQSLDRERLFDRFYRGDPSRNRRVDGSGLGLSLAREISRAHSGDLTVDAAETREGWVAFRLVLPTQRV